MRPVMMTNNFVCTSVVGVGGVSGVELIIL